MKWLHISDIHFNPGEDGRSTQQLRKKLPIFLKEKGIVVDEIFVTGDYRHAGKQEDSIVVAQNAVAYIKQVASSVEVDAPAHIHVIPGNHDLERQLLPEEIRAIRGNYDINTGCFADGDLVKLSDRFSFFYKITESLYSSATPWTKCPGSLHKYQCGDDYSLLYMNTAISCGDDSERGNLVIGNYDLYNTLEEIKRHNPDAPIIILAHHATECFSKSERETVEKIFRDYPVKLYLCGDAHEIWFREINNVLELTMGCIKQSDGVQAVFSVGEICDNKVSIAAYIWDAKLLRWGKYVPFTDEVNDYIALRDNQSVKSILLPNEWFEQQNKIQISNLGNRYIPELNIPLEIHDITCGIARDEFFKQKFMDAADQCLVSLNELKLDQAKIYSDVIRDLVTAIPFVNCTQSIDIASLVKVLRQAMGSLKEIEAQEEDEHKLYRIHTAINKLYDFKDFLDSDVVRSSNQPYMLIYGEGGIGKSHMMAEIIAQRTKHGQKSILLLGQHFLNDSDPVSAILAQLQLGGTIDELLQHLDQMGAEQESRILFIIDALNEGVGKTIWKDHLAGLVQRIKPYHWLGLIVTIRSPYLEHLLSDNAYLGNNLILVEHHGLLNAEYAAISKYFSHYNVPISRIPPLTPEFENPLFLRLFCESYSVDTDTENINLNTVYSGYIRNANRKIAEKCGYNKAINIVQIAIERIVKVKHEQGKRHSIDPESCYLALTNVARHYNIQHDLVGAFLSEGILTQNVLYDGTEYFYITYEKLDDYVYSVYLATELNEIGEAAFAERYARLIGSPDILQTLAITLAENSNKEIFEVFPEHNRTQLIMNSFVSSLQWRSTSSITKTTDKYINEVVCKYWEPYRLLVDTLVMLSTKPNHPYGVERLDSHLKSISMPTRDAIWAPALDYLYMGGHSAINKLIDWAQIYHDKQEANNQTVLSASIVLAWFLLSPTKELRDCSTKALIKLLSNNSDALIMLLEKFSNVDDPYIMERLYAVVFGCAVVIDEDSLHHLATYVYEHIFNVEYVFPNILLRDYAKNVIDYATHVLGNLGFDYTKVAPPYRTTFPDVPSDEETKQYNIDKPGAYQIWRSMKVEYSREGQPGGYGDFGRYTFQSYFRPWKMLHPMDLKNIALKRIYNLGYNPDLHGKYDTKLQRDRFAHGGRERIGKKYQWIAFHELAAQVADNYPMQVYTDDRGGKAIDYCMGSFEPNIRNIDPSIAMPELDNNPSRSIHDALYSFPTNDHYSWSSDFTDFPPFEDMQGVDFYGRRFTLLNGWYSWTEDKAFGEKPYERPQKDMWASINCYIVHEKSHKRCVDILLKKDFMGRWMPEPSENYHLYNKEYYWSQGFEFYKNPYYGGEEWKEIEQFSIKKADRLPKVLLPTFQYMSERSSDTLGGDALMWYKPCSELFSTLELRYGKENSALYDKEGRLICFDSKEVLNESIGFFIDQEIFNDFLKQKGYRVFWTLLAEKRVLCGNKGHGQPDFPMTHISGLYHCNDGKLVGTITEYSD